MALNSTERFSTRVANYARYRPGYPAQVLDVMRRECGLLPEHVIADVASGTGIFTRMLLENGNRVFAVEPNAEMRKAGDESLAQYKNFASINGKAEATTLFGHTMDFVTAAQAAHWFDPCKTNAEFKRILKRGGWLVLIWNERRMDTSFGEDYEKFLAEYGTDYGEVHRQGKMTASPIADFFAPSSYQERTLPSEQKFDYSGLEGRVQSASYAPEAGHPQYQPMLQALRELFDRHQRDGQVTMEYETKVYFGQPA